MQQLVTILLRAIEQPVPVHHFTGAFLKQWPSDIQQAVVSTHLLQQAGMESRWPCRDCECTCLVDVEWQHTEHGPCHPYIACDHPSGWGTMPLDVTDLQLWRTSFSQWATATTRLLGLPTPREEVITDRLWWLGGTRLAQREIEVFLARGAQWTDAVSHFRQNRRLQECTKPLVLVPWEVPMPSPFPDHVSVRSLATVLHCDATQLRLRHADIAETVRQTGAMRHQTIIPIQTPADTRWEQVTIAFANDEQVQVTIGRERHIRSFAEMGFADLRKPIPAPSELWGHLRTLAQFEGRIGWDTAYAVPEKDRYKVRKWISGIRQKLQVVFPDIAGDPFAPYQRAKAYQLKCLLRYRAG